MPLTPFVDRVRSGSNGGPAQSPANQRVQPLGANLSNPWAACTVRTWKPVVLISMVILALAACSTPSTANMPTPGSASVLGGVSKGQELFRANCAVCHGASGEGQSEWHIKREDGTLPAPPLNGDGHTWHHADGLLYRIVSQGGSIFEDPGYPGFKSGMPAFGSQLSRQEIIAVITYVKSLWAGKTRLGLVIGESQALVSEEDPFPSDGD